MLDKYQSLIMNGCTDGPHIVRVYTRHSCPQQEWYYHVGRGDIQLLILLFGTMVVLIFSATLDFNSKTRQHDNSFLGYYLFQLMYFLIIS